MMFLLVIESEIKISYVFHADQARHLAQKIKTPIFILFINIKGLSNNITLIADS